MCDSSTNLAPTLMDTLMLCSIFENTSHGCPLQIFAIANFLVILNRVGTCMFAYFWP